jgi:glycosyltransferase involved in cell wall biosynthesis
MRILFLDQSGKLGGAELLLLDIATYYRNRSLVGLFENGPFCEQLQNRGIPVQVLGQQALAIRKDSGLIQGLRSLTQLVPLVQQVLKLSQAYDVIYANTQKAFVVGAIASLISRRPLVYSLQDILSREHFSATNLKLAVTLANRCAALVIANSHATRDAFVQAGGKLSLVQVIYNGFDVDRYEQCAQAGRDRALAWKQQLGLAQHFVVGHFSRLSPWKGQHILIEAIGQCPEHVAAVFVGDALFGETAYVEQLHQQVARLGLEGHVKFLGFQNNIPELMASCDLVAHTSTAPEPFGRVIIEAMLCRTPIVAAAAGGALELVEDRVTGWLTQPGNSEQLAQVIHQVQDPILRQEIITAAQGFAHQNFTIEGITSKITDLLFKLSLNHIKSTL